MSAAWLELRPAPATARTRRTATAERYSAIAASVTPGTVSRSVGRWLRLPFGPPPPRTSRSIPLA